MSAPTREEIIELAVRGTLRDNPTSAVNLLSQQLAQIALLLRAILERIEGEDG